MRNNGEGRRPNDENLHCPVKEKEEKERLEKEEKKRKKAEKKEKKEN